MSNKTWQEEFKTKWSKFSSDIHRTLCCYDKGNNVDICALCGVNADELGKNIEQFISDLRKKDEEELIKMIDEYFRHLIIIPRPDLTGKKLLQLIKDYYEN